MNSPPLANPAVLVIDEEYEPLADLICASPRATPGLALLWQELERASLTPARQAPADLVRMGSRVTFTDLTRRESQTARLVYPSEALQPVRLPVTSQVGAALLGLRPGAMFSWSDPAGQTRRVRVEAVEPPDSPRVLPSRRSAS